MKLPTLLLAGSLAANVVLIAISVIRTPAQPAAAQQGATTSAVGINNLEPGVSSSNVAAGAPAAGTKDPAVSPKTWDALRTDDLRVLADRLRAAGFPPALIRSIIGIQLSEQFAARRAELAAPMEVTPFWQTTNSSGADSEITLMKYSNVQRALSLEMNALYKAALGPDFPEENEALRTSYNRTYGDLPREKIEALQGTLSEYSQLQMEMQVSTRGIILPEDREKLAQLEQARQADLAKMLTPQELEEYNLRSSPTASRLRSQLSSLDPTEDEYRAIYRVQVAFDQQYGSLSTGNMTPDQQRERQTHQAELDAQIQALLSPDRAAEYKQSIDPAYRQISQLVTRLELPRSAAVEVVAVQKDIQERANALRADRTLSTNARNQQLAALADEATTKVTNALGARGLEAYKSYGGTWIQNLQPRPPGAPSPLPGVPKL